MLSIIVPVGREGYELYERAVRFVDELRRCYSYARLSCELIFVSDVRDQETLRALMSLAHTCRTGCRCLYLTKHIGKGGSVKNAVVHSRGVYIAVLDADFPLEPRVVIAATLATARMGADLLVPFVLSVGNMA